MIRQCFAALSVLVIAGCSHTAQTTSGADYLNKFPTSKVAKSTSPARSTIQTNDYGETTVVAASESELIRQAAAVEPLLRFPARFGLARIEDGRVTTIPQDEAALWNEMASRFAGFGSFTPVDPIIMEFTSGSLPPATSQAYNSQHGYVQYNSRDLPTKIRLGSARQHLDAVLIYEVGMAEKHRNRPLAKIQLSTLGDTVVTDRNAEAAGAAKAILLDVRNGYPYGTAQAEKNLSDYANFWDSQNVRDERRELARKSIAADLVPEVENMMRALITGLQANQLRASNAL